MATTGFEFIYTLHGGPPAILYFKEGSSETFTKGQAVVVGNDGYLRECADGEAIITGIAAEDAQGGTEGTQQTAVYVGSQNVFETAGEDVLAQAQVGAYCDLSVTAGGDHEADNGATTDNIFRILDIVGTIAAVGRVQVIIVHGLDTVHTEDGPPAA